VNAEPAALKKKANRKGPVADGFVKLYRLPREVVLACAWRIPKFVSILARVGISQTSIDDAEERF
jgi:hypothetical protein